MDDRAKRTTPHTLIETLDASVQDIATGAVSDAGDVQVEVRRMLADYERGFCCKVPCRHEIAMEKLLNS